VQKSVPYTHKSSHWCTVLYEMSFSWLRLYYVLLIVNNLIVNKRVNIMLILNAIN